MYEHIVAQQQSAAFGVPPPKPPITTTALLPQISEELDALASSIDRLRNAAAPALRSLPPMPGISGTLAPVAVEPPIIEALQEFIRRTRQLRQDVDDIGQRLAL